MVFVINLFKRNLQRSVQLLPTLAGLLGFWLAMALPSLAESNDVTLGARSSDNIVHGLPGGLLTFVVAIGLLVLLLMILGIMSNSVNSSKKALQALASGPSAQNLFLGVKYASSVGNAASHGASPPTGEIGYLRSLGITSASFVCSEHLLRDQKVSLFLGTLPGFPESNLAVEGQVIRSKSLGGVPESFLVQIRFGHITDQTRQPLLNYLSQLTHKPSALSQA